MNTCLYTRRMESILNLTQNLNASDFKLIAKKYVYFNAKDLYIFLNGITHPLPYF